MTRLRSRIAAHSAALVIRLSVAWAPVARLLWSCVSAVLPLDGGARGASSFSGIRPPVRGGGGGYPGVPRFGAGALGPIDQDIRSVALSGPTGDRTAEQLELQNPPPRAAAREQESPYSKHGHLPGELLPYRHVGENSCGRLALLYDGVLDAYQPMLLRSERVRTPGNRRPATGDLILCTSCAGSLRSTGALQRMETAEGWTP